ncbi:dihydrolipoyllysine-residue succinyltransferase component of 2-oxoglutarate dehydrogenase complex [bacterium BMS3Abin11]|nr:dihydrolipoyllysine-residue succinyltransferase component of 2-oxoglutarate dehydrogenase complex [bacterium BMS3Abin11]GMT41200.1 MAG: dihydrolipoyllysine-residue succinyltransferase component of 2-oxoglutarate dehydrogenase complex [bacterium]
MGIEIKVPVLPESVMDATVVKLYVQKGDVVERDAPVMDLETDKIVLEVPAPEKGVISDINTEVGAVVKANEILAVLDNSQTEKATGKKLEVTQKNEKSAMPVASPAAEKIALENHIDLSMLTGTGKGQRITKQDVLNLIGQQNVDQPDTSKAKGKVITPEIVPPAKPTTDISQKTERPQRREPMSRLRQRIAQRLLQAQQEAAILTTFNEINMQAVMDARVHYKDEFEKRYGARLGFMSFFVKACTQALQNYPIANASIDGNDIIYHDYIDIGIAISSPRGLVVPVLRNVQNSSFGDIETQILEMAQKARDGKLTLDDLTGGTFSITNGGVFGSMLSTPLLNPPQSAILGMHNISQRAMVENGEIVIRPMMYLALSYDHRLIDGRDAVQFLVSIKQDLEDPSRLLIGL